MASDLATLMRRLFDDPAHRLPVSRTIITLQPSEELVKACKAAGHHTTEYDTNYALSRGVVTQECSGCGLLIYPINKA